MSAQSETVSRSPLVSRTETVKPDPFKAAGAGSSGAVSAGTGSATGAAGSGGRRSSSRSWGAWPFVSGRDWGATGSVARGATGSGVDGASYAGAGGSNSVAGAGASNVAAGSSTGSGSGSGSGSASTAGAASSHRRCLLVRGRCLLEDGLRLGRLESGLRHGRLEDQLGIGLCFRVRFLFGLGLGFVGRKRRLLGRGRNAGVDTQRGRVELGFGLRLRRDVDCRLGGGGYGAKSSGIRLADHLVELGPTRDDEAHVLAEGLADVPVEDVVRRVGDRDEREALLESDRQRAEEPRLILAQEPRRLGIDRLSAQADERKPLLAGQETREVLFLEKAALDEDLAQPPTRLHALFEGVFDRFRGQESSAEDQGSKGGVRTFSQRSAHRPQFTCWARVSALFRLSVSDGAEVSPLRGVDCRSARIPSKISMRLNCDF